MEEETIIAGGGRDEQGRWVPGVSGNPEGAKPETQEQKIIKRAIKEIVKEYKENLAESLPAISPILIAKALEGDMSAIKEVHDRVMGKPEQSTDITSGGEQIFKVVNYADPSIQVPAKTVPDTTTEIV